MLYVWECASKFLLGTLIHKITAFVCVIWVLVLFTCSKILPVSEGENILVCFPALLLKINHKLAVHNLESSFSCCLLASRFMYFAFKKFACIRSSFACCYLWMQIGCDYTLVNEAHVCISRRMQRSFSSSRYSNDELSDVHVRGLLSRVTLVD